MASASINKALRTITISTTLLLAGVVTAAESNAPLLPDGGYLSRAAGSMSRNNELGVWEFVLLGTFGGEANRHLILLPAQPLANMLEARNSLGPQATFHLSGELLAYANRNYIIPAYASLVEIAAPVAPTPTVAAPIASVVAAVNPETFADDLTKRLEAQVKSAARTSDVATPTTAPANPFAPKPSDQGLGTLAASGSSDESSALPASQRVQDRRAIIERDAVTGAWRVLMHTGFGSHAGESFELFPCRGLEAISNSWRTGSRGAAVLISGEVTTYEGRKYLRPTRVRALSAGRGLGP
ncbi:MAG: hypothetical protein EXS00_00430 [Phycisphaerales bacterium]|nr:hypothetical protein [Phycisphaerales bacterium]